MLKSLNNSQANSRASSRRNSNGLLSKDHQNLYEGSDFDESAKRKRIDHNDSENYDPSQNTASKRRHSQRESSLSRIYRRSRSRSRHRDSQSTPHTKESQHDKFSTSHLLSNPTLGTFQLLEKGLQTVAQGRTEDFPEVSRNMTRLHRAQPRIFSDIALKTHNRIYDVSPLNFNFDPSYEDKQRIKEISEQLEHYKQLTSESEEFPHFIKDLSDIQGSEKLSESDTYRILRKFCTPKTFSNLLNDVELNGGRGEGYPLAKTLNRAYYSTTKNDQHIELQSFKFNPDKPARANILNLQWKVNAHMAKFKILSPDAVYWVFRQQLIRCFPALNNLFAAEEQKFGGGTPLEEDQIIRLTEDYLLRNPIRKDFHKPHFSDKHKPFTRPKSNRPRFEINKLSAEDAFDSETGSENLQPYSSNTHEVTDLVDKFKESLSSFEPSVSRETFNSDVKHLLRGEFRDFNKCNSKQFHDLKEKFIKSDKSNSSQINTLRKDISKLEGVVSGLSKHQNPTNNHSHNAAKKQNYHSDAMIMMQNYSGVVDTLQKISEENKKIHSENLKLQQQSAQRERENVYESPDRQFLPANYSNNVPHPSRSLTNTFSSQQTNSYSKPQQSANRNFNGHPNGFGSRGSNFPSHRNSSYPNTHNRDSNFANTPRSRTYDLLHFGHPEFSAVAKQIQESNSTKLNQKGDIVNCVNDIIREAANDSAHQNIKNQLGPVQSNPSATKPPMVGDKYHMDDYPIEYPVFVKFNIHDKMGRQKQHRFTNRVLEHFKYHCLKCGLKNCDPTSPNCPMYWATEVLALCERCRYAFHRREDCKVIFPDSEDFFRNSN